MLMFPPAGIPQDVLDGLQALRLRLEAKKQLQSDKEEAVPAGPAAPPPPLVDVGANLTHYRSAPDPCALEGPCSERHVLE